MQYLFQNVAWSALAGRKRHIRTVVCHRPNWFQRHPLLKTLSLINWSCEAVTTIQCSVARCLIKGSQNRALEKKCPCSYYITGAPPKWYHPRQWESLVTWQKMTTDDIISWSQSASFPPGATLFTSTLDECWMTTVVSEARELMTSNDKSRSCREISLKWDWATRVKQVFRPISCYRCCEDMMKALRLNSQTMKMRNERRQHRTHASTVFCIVWPCVAVYGISSWSIPGRSKCGFHPERLAGAFALAVTSACRCLPLPSIPELHASSIIFTHRWLRAREANLETQTKENVLAS